MKEVSQGPEFIQNRQQRILQPLQSNKAAVTRSISLRYNEQKILIEDMCRKTPYTGNGQTKIYGEAPDHFICASLK